MFETRAQIVKRCRIPKQLEEEVFAGMPVSRHVDGKPFYGNVSADEYLNRTYGCGYFSPPSYEKVLSSRPDGGRKVTTDEIAIYAVQLKAEGKTLKEIWSACRKQFPDSAGCRTAEQLRATMRRHDVRMKKKCGSIHSSTLRPGEPT